MLNRLLFKYIDNSALILFRIIFGLLCFLESFGAIFTGWVKHTFIDPKFTFTFIGFEWLQPLPGNWMYVYCAIMGIFGFFIMIGYKYRFSIITFTVMWLVTYLMQKSSYNNHYYLLFLICLIMIFQPANRYLSIDAKQNPNLMSNSMPRWCSMVFILQMFVVYTYAAIAKIYPDWLNLTVFDLFMESKHNYFLIGNLLQQKIVHYILAYGGILFDGLIIPMLLFKPTRKWAFIISIFFHMFNSIVFQVGIFPYLALGMSLFFFEPKTIQKIFLKKKSFYDKGDIIIPSYRTSFIVILVAYFGIQILLPLRHYAFKDNVLWTEEGHRLSWRMMLRTKQGFITYKVKNKLNGKESHIDLNHYLTAKQIHSASTKPDMIWQFAQYLKQQFKDQGQDVSVFVDCKIAVNGKPFKQLINDKIDLANVKWHPLKHSEWILPFNED